ncbi:hypothetical protein DSCO28_41690 [Desulfosarcina ovata subsp. sediminis]|uniref:Uncharacterized protein n=1 Tax=Desulfosarcina ovata subsp. sediminis TaxID=885957 RepID=A0A5K7ZTQ8_9BACT|nr:hypothetical protein [Desulfosarcina ovata]BBO83603.1 hypothetical protein DSCO28_41690 [Desulfosarcina ovata subsp. sediminis]
MKNYKEEIKLRLLTGQGNFNADLAHEENEEFDIEIARYCSRCLSDKELMVFFYLFRCEDSYASTCSKINRCKDRNYPVNTIVKYGRRAIDRMVDQIHKDKGKRLSAWIDRHRKWKPEDN